MGNIDPVWNAEIRNGLLVYFDLDGFTKYCQSLSGKPLEVIVRKKRTRRLRTDPENRYYWAVIVTILSDLWGYTKNETHEILLARHSKIPGGPGRPDKIKRTSDMTTVEAEEYYENIRRWAADEFSQYIPLPNEANYQ